MLLNKRELKEYIVNIVIVFLNRQMTDSVPINLDGQLNGQHYSFQVGLNILLLTVW